MLEFTDIEAVATKEKRMAFLEIQLSMDYCVVDTESDPDTGLFLGMSLAFSPSYAIYYPVGHLEADANVDDEEFDLLKKTVESSPLRIMHHAMHDIAVLEDSLDFDMSGRFACTLMMAHKVDENVLSKDLDYLHKHYCGGIGKSRDPLMQYYIDKWGWRYVPVELMSSYGAQDARATAGIYEVLKPLYVEQFGEMFSEENDLHRVA